MLQVAWVCSARVQDASPGAAFFGLGRGLLPWCAVACWVKVYLYWAAQLKSRRRAAAVAVSQTAYCKTVWEAGTGSGRGQCDVIRDTHTLEEADEKRLKVKSWARACRQASVRLVLFFVCESLVSKQATPSGLRPGILFVFLISGAGQQLLNLLFRAASELQEQQERPRAHAHPSSTITPSFSLPRFLFIQVRWWKECSLFLSPSLSVTLLQSSGLKRSALGLRVCLHLCAFVGKASNSPGINIVIITY